MCCNASVIKKPFGLGSLAWLVIAMGLWSVAAAEPNQATSDSSKSVQDAPAVVAPEVLARVEGGRAKLIAFEKNTTIKDGLRILGALYEKNIVPWGKIDGVMNFTSLREVTFEEAMDAVLGGTFVCEQEGQLIKVYAKEEYKKVQDEAKKAREEAKKLQDEAEKERKKALEDPARMICRVYTLYYISAAEAGKLVQTVLSTNGTMKTSTAPDKALPTGQSITSGSGGGDTMALNDTLVVKDYPENMAMVEAMLKELDVRPKQVLVEATIFTARLTNKTEFGINWETFNGISSFTDSNMIGSGVQFIKGMTIGVSKANASVLIKAVEGITDVTVLANPKILAVNKQLGQVYIGKKLGYREGNTIGVGGVAAQGSVQFLDTGTKLSFRPYIGNDGYIRMDIHPKDSDGGLSEDGQEGKVPWETATELASNIIVKDGQTIVIGGLFRDSTNKDKGQVPVLGNLPILGTIFRSTSDTVNREEVIVLLTPHILDEPDAAAGQKAKEDIARKKVGAKDDLMPIDTARIVEEAYAKAAKFYLAGDKEQALKCLRSALSVRPTYLEAIRLKERILSECSPEEYKSLERIIRGEVAERIAAAD